MRFLLVKMVAACALFFIVSDATAANLCKYDPLLTQGGYSPSFILGEEVLNSKTFDETTLRQYESTKVEVVYGAGSGIESGSFVGVLLWDLINEAKVDVDPTRKNDQLRKYVVISGSDGYQVILALGEIIPDFGGQQVVVAYERDDNPLELIRVWPV